METYVNQLLKDADLSVVTKKHVRMKYKEHVGRELNPDEKSKINDMVYAFVKELSAAAQKQSNELETPEKTSVSQEESPGNKENKQSNQKSSTFIIKGQVVDRNDLYKSNSKKTKEKSPPEKQKVDEIKKKKETPETKPETKSEKSSYSKQKAAAAKLKINEVMSAVLGPDKDESSSEVSSVSSLTDTSLSEVEEEPEAGEQINEALEKLKAAREKKIQMSIEKKNKTEKKEKAKTKTKARRSLAMEVSKLKDKKPIKAGDDSEEIILISDLASADSDVTNERLAGNDLKGKDSGNMKKLRNVMKDSSKPNSDSGELKLTRTPQSYDKHKKWITGKKFVDGSEKKKKFVKRKRKKIEDETTSDSDSEDEDDVKKTVRQRKDLRQRKTNKKKIEVDKDLESDSEDETLDKIAARCNNSAKSVEDKVDKIMKEKQRDRHTREGSNATNKTHSQKSEETNIDSDVSKGDTPLAKKKKEKSTKVGSDSEHSTGDTPLAKKKKEKSTKVGSDSEHSTRDTPLAEKKKEKSTKVGSDSEHGTGDSPLAKKKKEKSNKVGSDSEHSTGDTPLVRKKKIKKRVILDSDSESGMGNTPLAEKKLGKVSENSKNKTDNDNGKETSKKSIDVEKDEKGNIPTLSELSSGDMPLAQIKKNKKTKSESVVNKEMSVKKKTKVKKSLGYDSDESSEETLLAKKKEKIKDKTANEDSVKSAKRKRRLSESSSASTGDTPLIRKSKKQKLNKTSSKENDSNSELSDVSTGDTPLVYKKKLRVRIEKVNVHIPETVKDSGTKSGEKMEESTDDLDTHKSKNKKGKKELPCEESENSEDSPQKAENCDNIIDNDSPLKMVKGHRKGQKRLESSSEGGSPLKKPPKKKKTNQKEVPSDSVVNGASSQSDPTRSQVSDSSDADSDDSDDVPLAVIKQTVKTKMSDLSSDSEDDLPLSKTKAAQSKEEMTTKAKSKKQVESGPVSDHAYLRQLRQICRECQMFVRNDRELAGCNTDKEKIEKLEQMLRNVGMKGKPSMKKAEEVKLMKEAKELSAENIISSETGRVMRKVKSIWARRTISPVKPAKSATGNPFAGLEDIVDSEGTESG
ncbi:nucleolar protein dao-5-like isoform X1 [Mercenaria mercenaria]|uniref:nucleolar protein dao-5-like isoform X1 n=1 Tax=Mercenaria mercenaria TaxID=6596 RepID=UPI00234F23C1|nr:nucleolar protein dao-5-like isoform X1 [Mercenaria mercenaria]